MLDDDDEERPAPPPFALGRSETTTSATTVGMTNFARHNMPSAAVRQMQQRPIINLMDESLDAVLDGDDDDDEDDEEYDDEDGIEIPPPPPPPKLPTLKESMARRIVLLRSWRPRNATFAFAKGGSGAEDDGGSIRIVTLAKSGTETTTETNIMNNYDNNNSDNDKKRRQRGMGIGIAALLLTVIVALGLGLGLRGVRDNNSEKNSSSSSSSSNEASANDIADTEENGTVDQEEVNEPSSSSSSSSSTPPPPPPATATTTYDVIIIGAGWAGIRALETLLSRNITNVLLIESTSVIGGRCRSYNADGSVNDPNIIIVDDDDDDDSTTTTTTAAASTYNVGADWLYANTDMSNVLLDGGYLDGNAAATTDTAIPNGLLTGQYYYRQTATSGSSSSSTVDDDDDDNADDAGIITTTFITAKAMSEQSTSNLMNDIWGNFHTTRTNELNDMFGMSYDDAINYYIDNNLWLYDYTVNTDDDIAATATAGMAMDFLNFMKSSSEIENSGDSSKLDITDINYLPPGYTSDSYYMGGIGFGNLVAQYAQKYISYIMLNSRVIAIDSSEESSSSNTPDVSVVSYVTDTNDDDGINSGSSTTTTTTTTVQAKTVLVTVSLGVLKSDRIQFIPPLPENKRTIINAMGYGTLNKCILSWKSNDAIVWPIDESWFMLLTESNNDDDEEESAAVQRRQRWTTFFNPTLLTGQPTLVAYVGGDDAIATESQTRNDIVEDVMTNLRSMFPDITNPDNVIVTRWGSEEDFYGAYAYPIAGRVMAEDAAILAEPIGRLYFAGEATSATRWGTTMGAWNTGEEQAYAITARLLGW